jgi:hypothetical protein
MRFFAFLEYAAVVVGIIGMVASKFFFLPKGFHLGLFLIGVGFALGGLESLFTRRMSFRFATRAGEGYDGAPAMIWGGMALLIGVALIGSAYLMEQGMWRTAVNGLMRRPGPGIAAVGLIVAGAGALLMFNPRWHGIWWTLFVRIPKTLLGLLLIAAGIAAVGLGILEWVDPHAYGRVSKQAWEYFDYRAIERLWRSLIGRFT